MPQPGRRVSPLPVTVERYAVDDPGWLTFLRSHSDATAFHHPAWSKVLARSYGYPAFVLALRDADGTLLAGMPALEMRGIRRRARVRALPFTDYCPPLASSSAVLSLFTEGLAHWRETERVSRIAVHGQLSEAPGVTLTTRAVRHVLPLGRESGEVFERLPSSSVRRAIRKAQRHGVETHISQSQADLPTFYRLHLETRRRLGVPVQPLGFIEAIWEEMLRPGLGFVVHAWYQNRPIAAALFLAWNRQLIYKFGASDSRYWALRPNNLVIWTAIDWACRRGYRTLDFGLTDVENRGLRDFKQRWGAIEVPLLYSYIGRPSNPRPRAALRALSMVIRSSPPVVCQLIGNLLYRRLAPNLG